MTDFGTNPQFTHKTISNKAIYKVPIRPFPGGPFKFFTSAGSFPKVTDEGRQHIVNDTYFLSDLAFDLQSGSSSRVSQLIREENEDLIKNLESKLLAKVSERKITADHYEISTESVRKIIQAAKTENRTDAAPRSGRPSQFTPTKRKALKNEFNQKLGRTTLSRLSKDLQIKTTWNTSYNGVEHTAPSASTLSSELRNETWHVRRVIKRPLVNNNPRAVQERIEFAQTAKAWEDTMVVWHDESYIQPRLIAGRYLVDLLDTETAETYPIEYDTGGRHEPKVFLFGAVTCPKTVEINGQLYIHPRFDGKVLLARVRGMRRRQRSTINGQVGEPIYEEVTINGARYKRIFEMEGGYMRAMQQYMRPELRPPYWKTARVILIDLDEETTVNEMSGPVSVSASNARFPLPLAPTEYYVQEDGAPGHGFDNRNNRGSEIHANLVYNCQTQGLELVKQSRHSPETNLMDLAVWRIIKTGIENRAHELPIYDGKNGDHIAASIWKIAKDEWVNMDPCKLFYAALQRRLLLDEIIRLEGKSIELEPHTGLHNSYKVQHNPEYVLEQLKLQRLQEVGQLRQTPY